ncbi:hypothetical protein BDW22DRAFT_1430992 [Trametopsis cervina]|nr:hypothetical protein BDW22DRAFT_1430992 [Trametopsis cervina]
MRRTLRAASSGAPSRLSVLSTFLLTPSPLSSFLSPPFLPFARADDRLAAEERLVGRKEEPKAPSDLNIQRERLSVFDRRATERPMLPSADDIFAAAAIEQSFRYVLFAHTHTHAHTPLTALYPELTFVTLLSRRACSDARINNCFTVASIGLLYYDYLLTLPTEVNRYWYDRQYTWSVTIFFILRYLALVGHVPVIAQVAWKGADQGIYIVLSQALVGLLLNIRTYALYERDRRIKWVLVVVSLTVLSVGCWGVIANNSPPPEEPAGIGCNFGMSQSAGYYLIAAWGSLLVFDLMIFALTLYKVVSTGRMGQRSLFDVIIRDGAMYFGMIAAFNVCTILTLVLGRPLIRAMTSTLTNVISTSLISRLMFNIRDPNLTGRRLTTSQSSYSRRDAWRSSVPISTDSQIVSSVLPMSDGGATTTTWDLDLQSWDDRTEVVVVGEGSGGKGYVYGPPRRDGEHAPYSAALGLPVSLDIELMAPRRLSRSVGSANSTSISTSTGTTTSGELGTMMSPSSAARMLP